MRKLIRRGLSVPLAISLLFGAGQSIAGTDVPDEARAAQILFLGEQHDNAAHHALQAAWVSELQPSALVFEMLTPDQAQHATPEARADVDLLEEALKWADSGWPAFSMYYPIFAAAPDASIYGAGIPRARVRGLGEKPVAEIAPELSTRFNLAAPLPDEQQSAREALQSAAHCDALPEDLLPMMVTIQRLRDASLADAALDALEETGGPVVVITGNGHAREDWGAPALVRDVAPQAVVFSLGQGESGRTPEGGFSSVVDGPAVDRGDPCAAFK